MSTVPSKYEIIAKKILAEEYCCDKICLLSQTKTLESAIKLVQQCQEQLHNLSQSQKKDFLRSRVQGCVKGKLITTTIVITTTILHEIIINNC